MTYFSYQQAELTFCAGDVITVFGDIDEDGFYYVSMSIKSYDCMSDLTCTV